MLKSYPERARGGNFWVKAARFLDTPRNGSLAGRFAERGAGCRCPPTSGWPASRLSPSGGGRAMHARAHPLELAHPAGHVASRRRRPRASAASIGHHATGLSLTVKTMS